ncbi:MAG: tetratricopeptide repeat protein [Planctomycetota bacterium]
MKPRTKKRVLLVVALGVVGVGALFIARTVREHQKAALVEAARVDGMTAYEAGDYEVAVDRLSYFVARNKNDREALRAFADSLLNTEDPNGRKFAQAIRVHQLLITGATEIDESHEILLDLLTQAGLATELIALADEVLALDPDHRAARLRRVEALSALARHQEAIDAASEFAAEAPGDAVAWRAYRGALLAADTDADVVAEAARVVAGREGATAVIRLDVAGLLAQLERVGEASAILRDVTADPSSLSSSELASAVNQAHFIATVDESMRSLAEDLLTTASVAADVDSRTFAAGWAWRLGEPGRTLLVLAADEASPESTSIDALGLTLLSRLELELSGVEAPDNIAAANVEAVRSELTLRSKAGDGSRDEADLESELAGGWLDLVAARRALEDGSLAEVRGRFDDAARRAPGLARQIASFYSAEVDLRTGERARARQVFAELMKHPSWRRARFTLAGMRIEEGSPSDAIIILSVEPTLSTWPEGARRFTLAVVEAARLAPGNPDTVNDALDVTRRYMAVRGATPIALSLQARALAMADRLDEASEIARELLDGGNIAGLGPEAFRLAESVRSGDPALADTIEAEVTGSLDETGNPLAAVARVALAKDPKSALELLATLDGEGTVEYDGMRAELLDRAGDPKASQAVRDVASTYADSIDAQLVLLQSQSGWEYPDAIRAAIARLKTLTGDGGIRWRVYSSRLKLETAEGDDVTPAASEALLQLTSVLEVDPANADALVLAGMAALRLDDRSAAIDYFDSARTVQPSRASLYPTLIALLSDDGQPEAVVARTREFGELNVTDPRLLRQRATLLESAGLDALAVADRRRLAEAGFGEDQASLVISLARSGNAEGAKAELETLDLDSLEDQAKLVVARAFLPVSEPEVGLSILETLPVQGDLGERDVIIAEYLINGGLAARTIERFEGVVETGSSDMLVVLVRAYASTSQFDEAARVASTGTSRFPQDDRLRFLADAFTDDGTQRVVRRLSAIVYAVLQSEADDAAIVDPIKAFLERDTTLDELADDLDTLTRSGNYGRLVYGLLAEARVVTGDPSGAVNVYERGLVALPDDASLAQEATRLLTLLGRFDDAARTARLWAERDPVNAWRGEIAEAVALAGLDAHGRAADLFAKNRDRLIANPEAFEEEIVAYAAVLGTLGRAIDGERLVDDIESDRIAASAAIEIATTLVIRNPSVARRMIEQATPQLSGDEVGRSRLVNGWYRLGLATRDRADIERVFSVAAFDPLSPESESAPTWALLGTILQGLGRLDEAEAFLRAAVARNEELADANNNLAYLLVRQQTKYSDAVGFAEQAVAVGRRRNIAASVLREYYDTLGLALMGDEQPERAAEAFREGLALDPDAVHISIGLAEALAAAGEIDEARAVIGAIDNVPDGELSDRLAVVRGAVD